MLIDTTFINTVYSKGLTYFSTSVYNQFAYDLYDMQYKRTHTERNLLMLLYALNSWDNRPGATNILTTRQLLAVMDRIQKAKVEDMVRFSVSTDTADCDCAGPAHSFTLDTVDSSGVHLSFSNNQLSAQMKISAEAGNVASLLSDGLFVPGSGEAATGSSLILIRSDDFEFDGITYHNAALDGKELQVFYRGYGFLLYTGTPGDATNEFEPVAGGGFTITIPGFNVLTGTNYFYVFASTP